ncbi:hypothetical protein Pmani_036172 [Petrolisthes manimaculis]|uniref:Uncharacterized protein n=1 Tax=Petrolisthes manimaculis TaxID=1843537 RepID=A0AAE1NKV9_9EUCA|nr:hypothetical protein Pmani_036172 [Petrolisthes manimaculis]
MSYFLTHPPKIVVDLTEQGTGPNRKLHLEPVERMFKNVVEEAQWHTSSPYDGWDDTDRVTKATRQGTQPGTVALNQSHQIQYKVAKSNYVVPS